MMPNVLRRREKREDIGASLEILDICWGFGENSLNVVTNSVSHRIKDGKSRGRRSSTLFEFDSNLEYKESVQVRKFEINDRMKQRCSSDRRQLQGW